MPHFHSNVIRLLYSTKLCFLLEIYCTQVNGTHGKQQNKVRLQQPSRHTGPMGLNSPTAGLPWWGPCLWACQGISVGRTTDAANPRQAIQSPHSWEIREGSPFRASAGLWGLSEGQNCVASSLQMSKISWAPHEPPLSAQGGPERGLLTGNRLSDIQKLLGSSLYMYCRCIAI